MAPRADVDQPLIIALTTHKLSTRMPQVDDDMQKAKEKVG
jgi:hypothetical protein